MFQWTQNALTWARRRLTGYPSSISPAMELAWLNEEMRTYATIQPFASPTTTPDGGLSAGETWEMRRGYREMALREPAVKSALLTKCMAVAALDPQMMPYNERNPEDKAAARWVDQAVRSSDGGWGGLIMDILTPSLIDGWSVTEPVWDKVDPLAGEYAGYWSLKCVKSKDTEYIRFRLDQFSNVIAVQAMNAAQGGRAFDPKDFIVFSHMSFFSNPFGISDLRAANRAANIIEAAIKLRTILLENFSGPFLVGKTSNATTQIQLKSILANARGRGWIVVPSDCEVAVIDLASTSADQFAGAIRDLREEIVMAIQGSYLQLLEGQNNGAAGNSSVHKTVSELFQWWLASLVCNRINKSLIPSLVRPNFGRRVGLPTVQLGGIDPNAIMAAIQRFKTLHDMGIDLSKDQIYSETSAEPPRDDSDRFAGAQTQAAPQLGQGGGSALAFADTFPVSHALKFVGPKLLGNTRPRSL